MAALKRVAVYTPNGDPDLREQVKHFARDKFPTALIFPRVNRFVKEGDLEKVDSVVILPEDDDSIGSLYRKTGVKVVHYEPRQLSSAHPSAVVNEPVLEVAVKAPGIDVVTVSAEPEVTATPNRSAPVRSVRRTAKQDDGRNKV